MIWPGGPPPVPQLVCQTGSNEKHCIRVIGRTNQGPIPSTTGGGKVATGSRTGCSSTRRGSQRGLPNTTDMKIWKIQIRNHLQGTLSNGNHSLDNIVRDKGTFEWSWNYQSKQYNHLASFGGFPDFGFPEHSKDEQDWRVTYRRNNGIEKNCKQTYPLVTFRQSSFPSPHCFKVQTPLHHFEFFCVNGFDNFNSSLVSGSCPQNSW